jgi:hypothetical protein
VRSGDLAAIPRLALSFMGRRRSRSCRRLRAALGRSPRILDEAGRLARAGLWWQQGAEAGVSVAQAQADGAELAITCGGAKSNHARVTAALCARGSGWGASWCSTRRRSGYEGLEPASLLCGSAVWGWRSI